MLWKQFEEYMAAKEALQPCALIKNETESSVGIAIYLCENLNKHFLSGDLIVFWNNGDYTTCRDDDEITILQDDLLKEDMSNTKAISETFESYKKALKTEVPECVRKWMFGDFEMSPEVEKILEKHNRKIRRGVKRICLKYRILLPLTVWRVKLKLWLKGKNNDRS